MEQFRYKNETVNKLEDKSSKRKEEEIAVTSMSAGISSDFELKKLVRRPRKRNLMKALKQIDIISAEDEKVIERLSKVGDSSKERRVESVLQEINAQYKNYDSLKIIVSPCGIPGCWIHTIMKNGEVKKHFKATDTESIDAEMQKAGAIVSGNSQWTCVEIYDNFMIHLTEDGDIIKIYE